MDKGNSEKHGQFIALFVSAQPALQGYICSQIPDLYEAEDVLQKVATVLWKKFDTYQDNTAFIKWAISTARYEVLHSRRAHSRRRWILSDSMEEQAVEYFSKIRFEHSEGRRRALEACLQDVSESNRALLDKRYDEQLSGDAIARTCRMTPAQVRTRLYRLRLWLKDCISLKIKEATAFAMGS